MHGRLSSRNVFFIDANAPEAAVSTGYEQGETEEKIDFTMTCTNCPVQASWVQFISNDKPIIQIAKTKITDSNFVVGTSATVPANLNTTFKILYWSDERPSAGWQIDFVASMKVQPSDPLFKYGKTRDELGWGKAAHLEDAGAPIKTVILGSATLRNASML